MFIAPVDATLGESEWRPFVETHPFGHLVAPGGPGRDLPVVVPTQFVLTDDTVWLHLVRANPIFDALTENPRCCSVWPTTGHSSPRRGKRSATRRTLRSVSRRRTTASCNLAARRR